MLGSRSDFTKRLLRWYDQARRDLPWRAASGSMARLDPYHVLVSETMLQQTQVSTVVPYFRRFIERFPTLADLAAADEQEVLRYWQGLGYYSRARNLQRAAIQVTSKLGGNLPRSAEQLLELPGIGRYTAGAISSIAFGERAPILDGNVQRVLCRVDRIKSDPREPSIQKRLWERAEEILPRKRIGDFNSALMELGATVCTPRSPQCLICPVRAHCEAFEAGMQERIPPPRKAKPTPLVRRRTFCIRHQDCWLLEQRPASGRWAGMWQFITRPDDFSPAALLLKTSRPRPIGAISHALTHRRYEFNVYLCDAHGINGADNTNGRTWCKLDRLSDFPLPRPHLKIAEMLRTL